MQQSSMNSMSMRDGGGRDRENGQKYVDLREKKYYEKKEYDYVKKNDKDSDEDDDDDEFVVNNKNDYNEEDYESIKKELSNEEFKSVTAVKEGERSASKTKKSEPKTEKKKPTNDSSKFFANFEERTTTESISPKPGISPQDSKELRLNNANSNLTSQQNHCLQSSANKSHTLNNSNKKP